MSWAEGSISMLYDCYSGHNVVRTIALERVQRRFTRMLPGVENCSDAERIDKPGPLSFEQTRPMEDSIELYKIMRGLDR